MYIEENEIEFPPDEAVELLGEELALDDRRFIVDSVNNDFGMKIMYAGKYLMIDLQKCLSNMKQNKKKYN